VAYLGFCKGGGMASAQRASLWRGPPAGSRGRAPGRGVRGQSPPEAETLLAFERSANSPIFFWNSETQRITASYQMQSHMATLIPYCIGMKKDHQTLLNFLQFLLENGKNAPFWYKVAFKNFHGGAKGGALHHGPPPKYATGYTVCLKYIFYYFTLTNISAFLLFFPSEFNILGFRVLVCFLAIGFSNTLLHHISLFISLQCLTNEY